MFAGITFALRKGYIVKDPTAPNLCRLAALPHAIIRGAVPSRIAMFAGITFAPEILIN